MDNIKGAIFDLDGVIVDTAKYHYLAWARLAKELGFDFTLQDNERLKGVSRVKSLEILIEIGDKNFSEAEKNIMAEKKNNWYVDYIKEMDESELLRGAKEYIMQLRNQGVKIALGSASKNAPMILENLKIVELFDAVIDGNRVSKAKPDPEVFILGALELGLESADCVVFEDAEAGVEAAKHAGMKVVGIGDKEILKDADFVISGLFELL
ncbi:MAG TPA: beta-phosphoglucomutase [Ruminiclostridium sp.]